MQIKNMTKEDVTMTAPSHEMVDCKLMVYDKEVHEELFDQFLAQYDINQQFEVEMNDEQDKQEFININRVIK